MRTFIYIDGFNFYYGAVRNTPYKWLDFKTLFTKLLDPNKNEIVSIKYFTAKVSGKLDPEQPIRQKTFIRALKTYIPEISVHYGHFLAHDVLAPLACYNKKYTRRFFVPIIKTEEKGSDVNLAAHVLNDSWLDRYDCAVIVSNDSDLVEAIKLIKENKKKVICDQHLRTPPISSVKISATG